MSYEQMMKEIDVAWNTSFENRMILADMKHMLIEFKNQKKFSLIDQTHRRELIKLMHDMTTQGRRPHKLWECSSYFRLKYLYLKELHGEL